MDKRKRRNIIGLGLLTVVAAALFIWGMYFLLGNPMFRSGMNVVVWMENGGGLKRGDRVWLQGVDIGTVQGMALTPRGVFADLRLDQVLPLPADTRASVTGDVFGAHTVALLPGTDNVTLQSGDTIRGATAPELLQMAGNLGTRVESVLANADRLLAPDAISDVHSTVEVLPESARELRAAFAEIRRASAALARSTSELENAQPGERLASAMTEVETTARQLGVAAERMEASLASFATVMDRIDRGEGTLGKLVNDSTLYVEFNTTLREMRALATDIRERPGRYINLRVF